VRTLLLATAALHAALFAVPFLTSTLDIMLAAGVAMVLTLATGVFVLGRNGPVGTVWVATAAGLTALSGWGSWLVLWALDPSRTDGSINVIGVLLPPVAVIVYLVAALLPQTRRATVSQAT